MSRLSAKRGLWLPPIRGASGPYLGPATTAQAFNESGKTLYALNPLFNLPVGTLLTIVGQSHDVKSPQRFVTAVADTGHNLWRHDIAAAVTSEANPLDVWATVLTTALTTTSSISVSLSDDTGCIISDAFSGPTEPFDVTAQTASGGSSEQITPTKAGDLLYAILGATGHLSVSAEAAGWTSCQTDALADVGGIHTAYRANPPVALTTYNPTVTFDDGAHPDCAIVAYPTVSAGGPAMLV